MKKYILTISTIIVTLLTISSCQDIDLYPKDDLTDTQFWKTPNDYMKAVNLLYDRMETFGTKDTDSDIAYGQLGNTVSNGTLVAPNSDGDWDDRFVDLRNCNKIIEKSESYEGNFSEIERYVAEARFFRAYTHWRLMKKFNDVPIVTKVLSTESAELYGTREPQAKVEDFILFELEEIYTKLPLQSKLTADENGRITQGTALALKARVALFAGTWAKYHKHRTDYQQLLDQAIAAAELVRKSNEYSLFEKAGDESYRRLFIEEGDNAPEAILSSRYYKDIRMHSTAHGVYWGQRGTPTKKLADMYLCKSTGLPIDKPGSGFQGYKKMADEFENRDPRMSQTFLIPGTTYLSPQDGQLVSVPQFNTRPETRTGYKLWKFMGEERTGVNDSSYDYHIIRYPEVLLILVEATYERNGSVSDEILKNTINVIRSRVSVEMPPLTNKFVQDNGLNMQTEIRRERAVELAFEGFRRDDIRRWKTGEVELPGALKGIKYKGTEYEDLSVLDKENPGIVDENGFLIIEAEANRFFTAPKHYYYSLPLNELFLNPNLLPNNPGW
ncbi:RagB/SusD family nutrient uptake outer membrane protein [Dysgonomonas sp. ZJ279]|uniref:RagB/SusD family nutrient uptake outer membrane protein n=1 Tax=Dysgonomonas sp. ZJ279 TaxID=2709796 RepID=UPI0013EBEF01|nr:RagB/SusD family nutrient uptake outer membrane protein [Dysgonomonas sp. ZJ279]